MKKIILLLALPLMAVATTNNTIPQTSFERMGITFKKIEGNIFVVPKSAIIFARNTSYIYKKNGDGTFTKIQVKASPNWGKQNPNIVDTDDDSDEETTKKLDKAKTFASDWIIESNQIESGDTIVKSGAEFINLEEMMK